MRPGVKGAAVATRAAVLGQQVFGEVERRSPKGLLVMLSLLSGILLPLALPSEFVGWLLGAFGVQAPEAVYWGNLALGFMAIAPALYAVSRAPTCRLAGRRPNNHQPSSSTSVGFRYSTSLSRPALMY